MILGTSQSDVLRRIRRGELQAESIPRPGGTMLRVLIDAPGATPEAASDPRQYEGPPHATATSDATLAAVQGLSDALTAERGERQRLTDELREETARRAASEATSEARQARITELEAERDALKAIMARPWWRKMLGLPPA